MNEEEYYLKSKKIRMKYESELLCELIYLNYQYYDCNSSKIKIEKIYNEMKNDIDFSDKEKNIIISNGLEKLKKKYNIVIDDNIF